MRKGFPCKREGESHPFGGLSTTDHSTFQHAAFNIKSANVEREQASESMHMDLNLSSTTHMMWNKLFNPMAPQFPDLYYVITKSCFLQWL